MPKQSKSVEDFSGGVNSYFESRNIKDNELAVCSGFKVEPGLIEQGGDMQATYYVGIGDSTAGESIDIEAGYGLFSFAHDYDKDGDLASTVYYALQNAHRINIYDTVDHSWHPKVTGDTYAGVDAGGTPPDPDTITDSSNGFITAGFEVGMTILVSGSSESANNTLHRVETVAAGTLTLSTSSALTADGAGDTWTITGSHIDLGTTSSDNAMASIKPCFFMVDGAFRVSPGNFAKVDSGADTTLAESLSAFANDVGGLAQFRYGPTSGPTAVKIENGDLIEIDDAEYTVMTRTYATGGHDFILAQRNVTGAYNSVAGTSKNIYVKPDAKWRGLCQRKAFAALTDNGTFSSWFTSPMSPRPPADDNSTMDSRDCVDIPFMVDGITAGTLTGNAFDGACMHVGYNIDEDSDAGGWGFLTRFHVTALYDDVEQESQPYDMTGADINISSRKRLAITVQMQYAEADNEYRINKRVVGGRIYYEDEFSEPGTLYQLLDVNFEKGCRMAGSHSFTPWVEFTANLDAICPHLDGRLNGNRTSTTNSFLFHDPPRVYTYEINTGYLASTNIHARFKTAVVANRRTYVGNVFQSNTHHGDRMVKSPVNKFDILPEDVAYQIDVAVGDGDEIVKLETFADRILQFKKRTLYIINVGGAEFLESQHANMGVENPSQTCSTEFGIAWVNRFGVYLYDGQKVIELTRGKLQVSNTGNPVGYFEYSRAEALNVTESNIPVIGYDPLRKWLWVQPQASIEDDYDKVAWNYDFKNGSWTWNQAFKATNYLNTNMIWTHDNALVAGFSGDGASSVLFKAAQGMKSNQARYEMFLLTKAFTLDAPATKKNLYSVHVTYSAYTATKLEAAIIYTTSGATTTIGLAEAGGTTTYYDGTDGFKTTSNAKVTVELQPTSAISNANSFQFRINNPDADYPKAALFKLYSISFVYRMKGVR